MRVDVSLPEARSQGAFLRLFALVSALFALELIGIVGLTGGQFTYSLDDPYIHLALADQIRSGHYGISAQESSSPSSSILWPFLLVPWIRTGFADLAPLLLNYLATLGDAFVLSCFFASLPGGPPRRTWSHGLMVTLGLVLLGAFPLAFMGLEHSFQLLLALLVATGLIDVARARAPRAWLYVAIGLGPLLRYESFTLVLGSAVFFWLEGRRKAAVLVLLTSTALPALFSVFLIGLGLPPLPLSVQAKSLVPWDAGFGGLLSGVANQVEYALVRSNRGPVFGLCAIALLLAAHRSDSSAERRLALASVLPLVLHVCFGQFGRYEAYVWGSTLLVLFWLFRGPLSALLRRPVRASLFLLGFTALVGAPSVARLFQTPFGARSIRAQQGSMARVARSIGEPIAVNDLGLVAYRNPNPVLDLYGLASAEALRARKAGRPGFLGALVRKHGVRVVAIYPSWFVGQIPTDWLPVGEVSDPRGWASTAEPVVRLYATVPEAVPGLERALREVQSRPSAGETVRLFGSRDP